ncbi:UNVERIFIED_CONTAM: hypothetical protein FKN15_008949 [Acipenser sinensis]
MWLMATVFYQEACCGSYPGVPVTNLCVVAACFCSEFCGENLSRYRFTRAVNKLNTNILHLCFSQHVDPELLHPLHTLRNIVFLVSPDNKNLGR